MSLINDALKQARQAPPRTTPNLPPLQPVAAPDASVAVWLIPALVIVLIVAAIFLIGWASAHHAVRSVETAPETNAAAVLDLPDLSAVPPPKPAPPPPLNPPDAPVLQGIFYSPTAPSAIVDGKTIRPGDQFKQYRVKSISKYTVTLVGPDKKEIQIGMGR
jgi:hypothetical protein